ncbi:hypothetical protein HDV06_004797 [Boothiomyces sp. JEL0866]|nr:hypothetical protein HDV06_004797 [Boothiomyces sp. JEL0866]
MTKIEGIAMIIKADEFMIGYLLKPLLKITIRPSTEKPKLHDCCKSKIQFWDIKLNEIEFKSVQQLGGGDVLNLSSYYTDDVADKSTCNYFNFECDLVKVEQDAQAIVTKYFPKMADLDCIVVMGKLACEIAKRKQTFRYNLMKPTNVRLPGTPSKIPNAYISDVEKPFSLDLYRNGNITFQSLSSMIPPYCMELKEGDTVLDVCAAPGGKSLLILEMIKNGLLICNEIDKHRLKRLQTNIDRMVPDKYLNNIQIIHGNGARIKNKQFDKILVDVPCSGEGIFNIEDESSFVGWSIQNCKKRQSLQKKLLMNTIPLLKPNGIVVYSTCTLNTIENEQVVEYLLQQYPFMKLQEMEINDGFLDGCSTSKDLSKCKRVLPSDTYQGFFIAKFKKTI